LIIVYRTGIICAVGYSDYDVFYKVRGVHGYIGVKRKSETSFQNFVPFLANWAVKFQKSASMNQQLFLHNI
jgi:hypothetical protein